MINEFYEKFKGGKRQKPVFDLAVEEWFEGTSKVGYKTSILNFSEGEIWEYKWMEEKNRKLREN